MDAKELVELRKQAERAVADMPDGELKLKAFEVMLSYLLGGSKAGAPAIPEEPVVQGRKIPQAKESKQASTLVGRILVLRDEGYFKSLRALGEVRDELKAHGWHYPLTTLSGTMQTLTQRRELRRLQSPHGKKKVYKYSNP